MRFDGEELEESLSLELIVNDFIFYKRENKIRQNKK
jgi:hypothetical protein